MLGKQFWLLIKKSKMLFSRVFKGWYLWKTSPLEPIRSYSPSYEWRSITLAKSLVRKVLIKKVGSWSSISVRIDPWLPTIRPRPGNSNQQNLFCHLTMDSLINVTSRTWNSQAIRLVVDPNDAKIIGNIPSSLNFSIDHDGWPYIKKWKIHSKIRLSGGESVSWYGKNESVIWTIWHFPERICLESTFSTEDETFLIKNSIRMSIGKENLWTREIQCDTHVCTVWSSRWIDQSCFFLMSSGCSWGLSRIPSTPICF